MQARRLEPDVRRPLANRLLRLTTAMRTLILCLGALPWLAWLLAFGYIRIIDGWGAFAAAWVVVASLVTGAALTLAGVTLIVALAVKRRIDLTLVLSTAMAASLLIYASWYR